MDLLKKNKYTLLAFGFAIGGYVTYKHFKSKTISQKKPKINSQKQFLIDTKWFNTIDPSSLSNIDEFTTLNYNMDLYIDFKKQKVQGKINYTLKSLKNNLQQVLFDVKCLKIQSVDIQNENEQISLNYEIITLQEHKDNLGEQLKINLENYQQKINFDQEFNIIIAYETHNPENQPTAFNWLTPEQTLGKKHPYLFTQCEPIFARSMFPCQDSPSVKATFQASMQVVDGLQAWCSGKLQDSYKSNKQQTMVFDQTIPIPSYLFSIVAGNLECRNIGERCAVITEPEFLDTCCKEFEDMEIQLSTIENYLTPYSWREFKVVVLPPSFPYGGMENPLLTFVSPSIVVGDKSQTSVVIHEMVHSWAGNLVSCKNWQNFFLNEGLTVFIEHKANFLISGLDQYQILNKQRDQDMASAIKGYGETHSFTSLQPDIRHSNPDDSYSIIPYIKGCQFFMTLEKQLGNDQLFQKFLKQYFTDFSCKSIDYEEFIAYFKKFFSNQLDSKSYQKYMSSIDFDTWIYKPGFPPCKFDFESQTVYETNQLVQEFLDNTEKFCNQPSKFNEISALCKPIFFQSVIDQVDKYSDIKTKIVRLNQVCHLNQYLKQYDIGVKWLVLAIKVGYEPTIKEADAFLGNMGRMKYVRPVYKALIDNNKKDLALQIYQKHKNFYHTIAAKMVAKDLQLQN